ncbi:GntR family transcriptional regulator [Marinovum sp.]|uniref:GntR family transcriptional regulator n=1 Tax=Marinovum sp. TaxID=2024839 RepID=UPI002B2745C0|nr:GntR family transcriptional regulator [Marinovum sp.]
MTRDRPSVQALPLYLQISEVLLRDIAAGRLVEGERLPPERDMARQHGTSVTTLRKALAELEGKGLLERIQGSGNYIRAGQGRAIPGEYSMFRLELRAGGGLPTSRLIDVVPLTKDHDWGAAATASRVRRLRLLGGRPAAVEEIWLDADAGRVEAAQISDSLYRYYRLRLGLWITRAEDRVTIDRVPDWAPEGFGPAPGALTGYVERYSWGRGPQPVEFSRTWFDTDVAQYVQRMT